MKNELKPTKIKMIESIVLKQNTQIEMLYGMIFNLLEKTDKDFQSFVSGSERKQVFGFKRFD